MFVLKIYRKYKRKNIGCGGESFARIKPRKCLNNVNRFNFCHCGKVLEVAEVAMELEEGSQPSDRLIKWQIECSAWGSDKLITAGDLITMIIMYPFYLFSIFLFFSFRLFILFCGSSFL